jgi:hypothetical protein
MGILHDFRPYFAMETKRSPIGIGQGSPISVVVDGRYVQPEEHWMVV